VDKILGLSMSANDPKQTFHPVRVSALLYSDALPE
jgi:hypothetical protein